MLYAINDSVSTNRIIRSIEHAINQCNDENFINGLKTAIDIIESEKDEEETENYADWIINREGTKYIYCKCSYCRYVIKTCKYNFSMPDSCSNCGRTML